MLPLLPGFNPADSSSTTPLGLTLSSLFQGQSEYTEQSAMFALMLQQAAAEGGEYKSAENLNYGNLGVDLSVGSNALGFINNGIAAEQIGVKTDWSMIWPVNYAALRPIGSLSSEVGAPVAELTQAGQNLPPLSEISPLAQAVFDNLAVSKPVSYATATLQVSVDVLSSDPILSSDPSWSFGLAALGLTSQNPSPSLEFDLPWALVAVGLQSAVQDVSSPLRQDVSFDPVPNVAVDILNPADISLFQQQPSIEVTLVRLPGFGPADQIATPIETVLQLPAEWVLAGLLQQQASVRLNENTPVSPIFNGPQNTFNSLEMTSLEDGQNVNAARDRLSALMTNEFSVTQSARQAELGLSELAPKLTPLASFGNSNAVNSLSYMANVSSFAMSERIGLENQNTPLTQLASVMPVTSALPVAATFSAPVTPAPVVIPTNVAFAQPSNAGQVLVDSSVATSVNQMVIPVARSAGLQVLPFTNAQRMTATVDVNMPKLAMSLLSDTSAQLRPVEAIMAHNNQLISQALSVEMSEAIDEVKTRLQDDSALNINSFLTSANGVSTGAMERPVMALPAINYALRQAQWETALGQRLMYVINQQVSQAQIQLNPAHLGPIRLMINFDRDQTVQVQMLAQHSQTKDAMEQALPRLREMLNEAGIKFDQLQVLQDSADNSQQGTKQSVMVRANESTQEEDTAMVTESIRSPIAHPHTIDFYV